MEYRLRKMLPEAASIAIGILPVAALILFFHVPRKIILGWGILSYVLGVAVLKMPLYHWVIVRYLHPRLRNAWLGLAQGLTSAAAELGAALVFFLWVVPNLTLPQLIGFGAAAGALEAVLLPFLGNPLQGTPLEEHAAKIQAAVETKSSAEWWGVVERLFAMVTHITTRGLLYVSLVSGNPLPAIIAVATFSAVDGTAYYGHLERWKYDENAVMRKFMLFFGTIAILQIIAFAGFFEAL